MSDYDIAFWILGCANRDRLALVDDRGCTNLGRRCSKGMEFGELVGSERQVGLQQGAAV